MEYGNRQSNSVKKRKEVMVVLDIIMRTPCGMWISNGKVFAAGVVMNRAEDTKWKMLTLAKFLP